MGSLVCSSRSSARSAAVVSPIILLLTLPCSSYVVVSETAALRVKEKTNLLACVISVLVTFVTSFTIPYLINDKYAALGGKVGYIYGTINVMMVVATYFFIPELKGRTLEEVDQLFASGIALRKFKNVKTQTAEEIYEDQIQIKSEAAEKKIGGATTLV